MVRTSALVTIDVPNTMADVATQFICNVSPVDTDRQKNLIFCWDFHMFSKKMSALRWRVDGCWGSFLCFGWQFQISATHLPPFHKLKLKKKHAFYNVLRRSCKTCYFTHFLNGVQHKKGTPTTQAGVVVFPRVSGHPHNTKTDFLTFRPSVSTGEKLLPNLYVNL